VPAGRGRVVRELLLALEASDSEHRFRVFCRRPWTEASLGARFDWVADRLPDPLWHVATAARASRTCDVFLSTNSYLTAWMLRVPCAVIVHDMIAFLPHAPAHPAAARIERATIGPAIRRAERFVCNSRSTERDLVRLFPQVQNRTSVLPFAADPRFHRKRGESELEELAQKYGVARGRFVLAAGTLEPRKNLLRLIRAHAALSAELRERHPLLIVGPRGWEERELMDAATSSGDVRLAGFVPDEDLAGLYGACAVFAYPSLYEGFGLPVLEAMAAGAAVLTSDVSSLPEVGSDAVHYVSPEDEEAITESLERLLRSQEARTALGERARRRAGGFSWERVAKGVLEELEAIAPVRS